jgi:hypothetical protein
MDVDKKRELKGQISLADQALAPLTNLMNYLDTAMAAETDWLDDQEGDSDELMDAREKTEELQTLGEDLQSAIDKLNEVKAAIEVY